MYTCTKHSITVYIHINISCITLAWWMQQHKQYNFSDSALCRHICHFGVKVVGPISRWSGGWRYINCLQIGIRHASIGFVIEYLRGRSSIKIVKSKWKCCRVVDETCLAKRYCENVSEKIGCMSQSWELYDGLSLGITSIKRVSHDLIAIVHALFKNSVRC